MNSETFDRIFVPYPDTTLKEVNNSLSSRDYHVAIKYRNPRNIMADAIREGNYELFSQAISFGDADELNLYWLTFYDHLDWIIYTDLVEPRLNNLGVLLRSSESASLYGAALSRDIEYTPEQVLRISKYASLFVESKKGTTNLVDFPVHKNFLSNLNLFRELLDWNGDLLQTMYDEIMNDPGEKCNSPVA